MTTPVQLAERATLGALLVQPRQLDTVTGWLRPSDFAHWWHAEVYRALLFDPALAGRNDMAATAHHVRAALDAALGPTRADAPALHTLMRAAPDVPVAARYAAMVLEASIRRQVAGLAVHLQAAALAHPTTPTGGSPGHVGVQAPAGGSLREVAAVVDPVLADLGARWAAALTATNGPPPTGPGPTVRADLIPSVPTVPDPGRNAGVDAETVAGLGNPRLARAAKARADVAADTQRTESLRHLAVVADRALRAAPQRSAATARGDAALLVAALVTRADRVDAVAVWLRPEHLPRPARAVFEALLTLRQQRIPIDPVTVSWELQRASRAHGAGPADLLAQVEAAASIEVDSLIAAVAHDTLRATADFAAAGLRAAADNPGLTVGDVLDTAAWATQAVTRTAHDLPGSQRDQPRPVSGLVSSGPRPARPSSARTRELPAGRLAPAGSQGPEPTATPASPAQPVSTARRRSSWRLHSMPVELAGPAVDRGPQR